MTVRRGSPAAKSGQIRAGDRLEAVEGRPVVTLPHRELAQILRRAGNTLRLTIVPRPSTCKSTQTRRTCSFLNRPQPPSSFPRLVQPVRTRVRRRSQKQEGSKVASEGQGAAATHVNVDGFGLLPPTLTVHLSPSVTPGITAWTWNVGPPASASA